MREGNAGLLSIQSKDTSNFTKDLQYEEKVTHLVAALVSDEDDERPVVLLDIVVDQDRDAWVELLSH